jgi:hypothetical protein
VRAAIVDYSSTGATYQGLWAHLQQPLATTTGIYASYPTVTNLRTVRAQEGQENNLQERKATTKHNSIPITPGPQDTAYQEIMNAKEKDGEEGESATEINKMT